MDFQKICINFKSNGTQILWIASPNSIDFLAKFYGFPFKTNGFLLNFQGIATKLDGLSPNSIDFNAKFNGIPFKIHGILLNFKGNPSKFYGLPLQIQ